MQKVLALLSGRLDFFTPDIISQLVLANEGAFNAIAPRCEVLDLIADMTENPESYRLLIADVKSIGINRAKELILGLPDKFLGLRLAGLQTGGGGSASWGRVRSGD